MIAVLINEGSPMARFPAPLQELGDANKALETGNRMWKEHNQKPQALNGSVHGGKETRCKKADIDACMRRHFIKNKPAG